QGGYDEGELADLRERESRLHGYAQRLSRYEYAERGESRLSGEYHDREQHDGAGVAHEQSRFDHHAYRDEEDRAEEVLDRFDQPCDPFGCDRFGQERSHDEGAERSRETGLDGDHHHPQTQAERH